MTGIQVVEGRQEQPELTDSRSVVDRADHRGRSNQFLRWSFATIAILHSLMILVQPVLAGMSIDGSSEALNIHYQNGRGVMVVGTVQLIIALLWWRPGRGPVNAVVWSGILSGLVVAQFWIGYYQHFNIHVPLGIATLFCLLVMTRIPFLERPAR